ncbi:hypothetical protein [Marivita sp. S2033]|uniref:hypothetical protein n=1 Tax=Marivita sp. S2033 TaxID=3373187 RepID=UPI003981E75F
MRDYEDFSEAYEVAKTIEIVTKEGFRGEEGQMQVRIEILQGLRNRNYSVRWLRKEYFHLQPAYPVIEGKHEAKAGDFSVWVPLSDMPWVDEGNEDQAVQRALSWLRDKGA